MLAELDGTVLCLHFVVLRLIPYQVHQKMAIPVTEFVDASDLARVETDG